MPFQPAVTPVYGLQSQAWQMMNQAAGNLGRGIAEGIERNKTLAAQGKAADLVYKNDPEFAAMVPEDKWATYGSRDKTAALLQYADTVNQKLRQQQIEESKARMAAFKQQGDARQAESVRNVEERRAEEKIGRGLNDYFYQGPAGIAANRPVNRDTLAQWAVQQPGALQSENVRRLMQYAPEAPPAPWTPSVMDVPQMPGYKFVQTGPSGGGSVYNLNPPPSRGAEVTWRSGDPQMGTPGSYSVGGSDLAEVRRLVAEIEGASGGGQQQAPPPPGTPPPAGGVIRGPSGVTATPISGGTVNFNTGGEQPPAPEAEPPAAARRGPGMTERIDLGMDTLMAPVRRALGIDASDPRKMVESYQGQKQAILQGGFTPQQKEQLLRALVQRYAPALEAAGFAP